MVIVIVNVNVNVKKRDGDETKPGGRRERLQWLVARSRREVSVDKIPMVGVC